MKTDNHPNGNITAGTAGEAILVILLQTNIYQPANAAILAAVGTTVIFMMSVLQK